MSTTRVLVVDDSAFARKVLREVLSRADGIEVVGIARDGLEALEKIVELKPDVVTLDMVMPNLDGLGVLRGMPADVSPAVVVVSISDAQSELCVEALQLGAVDLVHKPTALATERLYTLSDELITKVRSAGSARPRRTELVVPTMALLRAPEKVQTELVVVGTSTGGPQALTRLLTMLPANFPVPICLALHIPAGYTDALAKRIDELSTLEVLEAFDGVELVPGRAVLARGGEHLKIERRDGKLFGRLSAYPIDTAHHPSVNVLFESALRAVPGPKLLAAVLTGMGDDGLQASKQIREAGGRVLTESAKSCVVYGMPRTVADAGLSSAEATIDEMAALILTHL